MALAPQFDFFEDIEITNLKEEMSKLKESHRATQKALFAKNGEIESQMIICREFMELFGTSLVDLMKRIDILEEKK